MTFGVHFIIVQDVHMNFCQNIHFSLPLSKSEIGVHKSCLDNCAKKEKCAEKEQNQSCRQEILFVDSLDDRRGWFRVHIL